MFLSLIIVTSNGGRVVTVVSMSATNWETLVRTGFESRWQCRWCTRPCLISDCVAGGLSELETTCRSLGMQRMKVKLKVCVYSPDIPSKSSDFTLFTPRYWNSLFHSLISVGRMQRNFCSCSHSYSTNFPSTWYPLLLGRQRWCGIKACPRLSHMTGAK